ncbi:MAG: DUF5009 domain-containing protein [Paludibacter sp.]
MNKKITQTGIMFKRATALDMLRGISIFGMVLSANIPFGVLPSWMYHAQTPPPSHIYNPGIPGLTWVDLVLPVFIFCMGVSIPLALNKRIESGDKLFKISFNVIERYLMLVIFAIFIAHIQPSANSNGFLNFNFLGFDMKGYDLNIISILGFLLLFPIYMVMKDSKRRLKSRIAGWTGAIGIIFILQFVYGFEFSLQRRNIIILLLANVYLLGALSWFITRKSTTNRLLLLGLWAAVQLLSKYTHFDEPLNQLNNLSWIFQFRMTHYMLLLIPATLVGDLLYKRMKSGQSYADLIPVHKSTTILFSALALFGVWLLIGLYNRWSLILNISTPIILAGFYFSIKKYLPQYMLLFKIAAYMILIGLILEPVEGGIKKDPVTASYLFLTGGISICWLCFLEFICHKSEDRYVVKLFSGAGSNPLLAYVATTWFVLPLLQISFLVIPYNWLYPAGYHWVGVIRAIILVLFVMNLVAWASRKKIVWRA